MSTANQNLLTYIKISPERSTTSSNLGTYIKLNAQQIASANLATYIKLTTTTITSGNLSTYIKIDVPGSSSKPTLDNFDANVTSLFSRFFFSGTGLVLIVKRGPGLGIPNNDLGLHDGGVSCNIKIYKCDGSYNLNPATAIELFTFNFYYDKNWYYKDGVDASIGYNPCIVDIFRGWEYSQYMVEIENISNYTTIINEIWCYEFDSKEPYKTIYSHDTFEPVGNISSLSSGSSLNDQRNDVLVVGSRRGVWIESEGKVIPEEQAKTKNPIYDNVYSRAIDIDSQLNPESDNYIGQQNSVYIQEPAIVEQQRANWLSSVVLDKVRKHTLNVDTSIIGDPTLDILDSIKIDTLGTLRNKQFWIESIQETITSTSWDIRPSLFAIEPWESYRPKTPVDKRKFGGLPIIHIELTDKDGYYRGNIESTLAQNPLSTDDYIKVADATVFPNSGRIVVYKSNSVSLYYVFEYQKKSDSDSTGKLYFEKVGYTIATYNNLLNATVENGLRIQDKITDYTKWYVTTRYNVYESYDYDNRLKVSFYSLINGFIGIRVKFKNSTIVGLTGEIGSSTETNDSFYNLIEANTEYEYFWDGVDTTGQSHSNFQKSVLVESIAGSTITLKSSTETTDALKYFPHAGFIYREGTSILTFTGRSGNTLTGCAGDSLSSVVNDSILTNVPTILAGDRSDNWLSAETNELTDIDNSYIVEFKILDSNKIPLTNNYSIYSNNLNTTHNDFLSNIGYPDSDNLDKQVFSVVHSGPVEMKLYQPLSTDTDGHELGFTASDKETLSYTDVNTNSTFTSINLIYTLHDNKVLRLIPQEVNTELSNIESRIYRMEGNAKWTGIPFTGFRLKNTDASNHLRGIWYKGNHKQDDCLEYDGSGKEVVWAKAIKTKQKDLRLDIALAEITTVTDCFQNPFPISESSTNDPNAVHSDAWYEPDNFNVGDNTGEINLRDSETFDTGYETLGEVWTGNNSYRFAFATLFYIHFYIAMRDMTGRTSSGITFTDDFGNLQVDNGDITNSISFKCIPHVVLRENNANYQLKALTGTETINGRTSQSYIEGYRTEGWTTSTANKTGWSQWSSYTEEPYKPGTSLSNSFEPNGAYQRLFLVEQYYSLTASKSGTTVTKTAGNDFASGDVDRILVWSNGDIDIITAFISTTQVTVDNSGTKTSQTVAKSFSLHSYIRAQLTAKVQVVKTF